MHFSYDDFIACVFCLQRFHLNYKTINDHYKSIYYPMNRKELMFLSLMEEERSCTKST